MSDQKQGYAGMAAGDSPFGINAHVPDDRQLDLVQEAGIKWVRLDFDWSGIEPQKGNPQYARLHEVVANARRRHLEIFATLAYTPPWANGNHEDCHYPPEDADKWRNFVARAVAEFKDDIKHWGMWNEPNLKRFWQGSARQYVDLILKPGSEAARKADPDCKIVAPDLCIVDKEWPGWITEIGKRAGPEYLHVFSCHVYKEKESEGPDAVIATLEKGKGLPALQPFFPHWKAVRRVLTEAGLGSKPIWLTEIGWHTRPGYKENTVSDETQATFYAGMCDRVMERKEWLQRIFFYELRDLPNAGDHKWGILTPTNEKKRSYVAYRDAIQKYEPAAIG